jgi:hypothetical protein
MVAPVTSCSFPILRKIGKGWGVQISVTAKSLSTPLFSGQISPVHAFLGVAPWSESLSVKSWLNSPGCAYRERDELKVCQPHKWLAHRFRAG